MQFLNPWGRIKHYDCYILAHTDFPTGIAFFNSQNWELGFLRISHHWKQLLCSNVKSVSYLEVVVCMVSNRCCVLLFYLKFKTLHGDFYISYNILGSLNPQFRNNEHMLLYSRVSAYQAYRKSRSQVHLRNPLEVLKEVYQNTCSNFATILSPGMEEFSWNYFTVLYIF